MFSKVSVLAALTLVVSTFCIAQDDKESHKFSVGASFSPNSSYRHLSIYDESLELILDQRNANETPAFGYNIGLSANYQLLKPLEITLGAQFARQSWQEDFLGVTTGHDGEPYIFKMNVKNRCNYLEVPLRINYRFLDEKFFTYASLGASLHLFINAKRRSTYVRADGVTVTDELDLAMVYQVYQNEKFSQVGIGLIGGLGVGYKATPRIDVRLEPLFRYSLYNLVKPIYIDQHNYSFGAQFGVNMKL